ncbi:MAG: YggS family pyridoxal phosphate-dependent enzyme [Actinobacteria bacterium]|nr:YggS family pyridoxal phosphate-dependent enzyme [Actinomycetota bacterium]
MSDILNNLDIIREKIGVAAGKSGRKTEDIKLVAVTKSVSVSRINEAISFGIKEIGENRAQEAVEKYNQIGDRVKWHFIGHLQKNKVKHIIKFVDLIHSIDSIELAEKVNKCAEEEGKIQKVLVQVNIYKENTKKGFTSYDEIANFLKESFYFKNLSVEGLMTIAPFFKEPEDTRPLFAEVRNIFHRLKKEIEGLKMNYLSMGMTNDFEVAIEEGANLVRIGSGIFGSR